MPSSSESNSLSSSSSLVKSIYILFGLYLYSVFSFFWFDILSGLLDLISLGFIGSKKSDGKMKWELKIKYI